MGYESTVSSRTWLIAAFGILVSATFMLLIRAGFGGSEFGEALVAHAPSLLTAGFASGVALWAALRFVRGEELRRQWMLIALGTFALFVGDATFAYLEVVARQEVPFPSVADAFYLISFPLFWGGLLLAVLSFGKLMSLKAPLSFATVLVGVSTLALWASVFGPIVSDSESTGFERMLGVFYPIGDLWLLVFPALALSIALSKLGAGRLARPWWAVVVGMLLIAVADTFFTIMESSGTYVSGSPIDAGWWLGYTAIAVGASLVIDVQMPRRGGGRS